MLPAISTAQRAATLSACWSSLLLDFAARSKVGGTHLNFFVAQQLPTIAPESLSTADLNFIVPRVLELTYTAHDLTPLGARSRLRRSTLRLGPRSPRLAAGRARRLLRLALRPLPRRAALRARPQEVMGADFPSETFRVLKDNDFGSFGEYRTRRLVLDAWDRFVADGTFDPDRDGGLTEAEKVRARLARTTQRLTAVEAEFAALVARAAAERQPVLFVEGISDVPVIEAAWATLHPDEPLPVACWRRTAPSRCRASPQRAGHSRICWAAGSCLPSPTMTALAVPCGPTGISARAADSSSTPTASAGPCWRPQASSPPPCSGSRSRRRTGHSRSSRPSPPRYAGRPWRRAPTPSPTNPRRPCRRPRPRQAPVPLAGQARRGR